MAAPLVSGQAALLLQLAPHLSPAEVHAHIRSSTSPLTSVPAQMATVGRIDLLHSLESVVARPQLDPRWVGIDDDCIAD
jgi:subtilisin family serine protease